MGEQSNTLNLLRFNDRKSRHPGGYVSTLVVQHESAMADSRQETLQLLRGLRRDGESPCSKARTRGRPLVCTHAWGPQHTLGERESAIAHSSKPPRLNHSLLCHYTQNRQWLRSSPYPGWDAEEVSFHARLRKRWQEQHASVRPQTRFARNWPSTRALNMRCVPSLWKRIMHRANAFGVGTPSSEHGPSWLPCSWMVWSLSAHTTMPCASSVSRTRSPIKWTRSYLRRIKKQRRYELLAATSQLSLW